MPRCYGRIPASALFARTIHEKEVQLREERLKHERLLREKELELQQERSLRIRMLSERLMEHERMDMQLQSYKDHIADITAYVVPEVRTLGQTSNTTHAHTRPPPCLW